MDSGCFAFLLIVIAILIALTALRKATLLSRELAKTKAAIANQLADFEEKLTGKRPTPESTPPPAPEPTVAAPFEPMVQPIAESPGSRVTGRESAPEPAFATSAAETDLARAREGARPSTSPPPFTPSPPPPFTPSPPPPVPPSPPPPGPLSRSFDWENLVGVKLFSWIAGIALALGAVFFLKYSVEHGWLEPPIRMAIGLAVGTAILIVCELRIARQYAITANAMNAAGIAILYATLFSAHARWQLLPLPVVFGLMALVTAVAVMLSIRRDSVFIALLGLVGGFATPTLLSTGEDRPVGLFSYLLLLNAGLAWVAYRKRWPVLAVLTLIFTTGYQWLWVSEFLTASKLPLAIGIFLVFPLLSVVSFWLGRSEAPGSRTFEKTAAISAALPLVFAIYAAAVPAYGARASLLFFFLLCVDLGLLIIAASRRGPEILHLTGGIATAFVFLVWSAMSWRHANWPSILPWIAAFVLIYASVPEILRRLGRDFNWHGRHAVIAAPALLFMFAVLAGIEPATASPGLLFGVLFGLLAVIAAFAIRYRDARMYALGAFFALVAEAVWSTRHLTPERVQTAMVLYLVFALFFLGIPFLARRIGRPLQLAAGGPVLLYLALAMLFFLAAGAMANVSLFAIAFLMLVLVMGMFAEPSIRQNPFALAGAIILSWLVLVVWWINATVDVLLVPALMLIVAFTLLTVIGHAFLQRNAESESDAAAASSFGDALYLGLAGHGFLLYVASDESLSTPPWPLLGALAVLVLALGVAALYARRANLHLVSLIAAQGILLIWEETARVHPWPSVAIGGASLLALVAMTWFVLSRRVNLRQDEEAQTRFAFTAAVTAILGQIVALVGAELPGAPMLMLVLGTHLFLLFILLRLAWTTGWHVLAVVAVPGSAMAYYLWRGDSYAPERWAGEMIFATLIYLCFIAYPLILGARAGRAIAPYLAAVLASVPYFFFSEQSWEWRGWEPYIGFLPVLQAGLMILLLVRLLRIEPARERLLSRLALIAAAALAFITVAIPLQLDKEWITIAWALEAAALLWLYRRIPHRGLVLWSVALFAAVFTRLVFNPAVLAYHPRSATPIFNWYLYTYLIPAAAFFAGSKLIPRDDENDVIPKLRPVFTTLGTILLFLLLNIEIADFYSKGPTITFNFSAGLAQDLTYTLGWAIFAIGMLIAGILLDNRPTRIASLALLVVSVLKCFLHDLMRLGGLYRVASLVGLAVSLALVAILLQRFVLIRRPRYEG